MEMKLDNSPPRDEASPSTINPFYVFSTIEENMDMLITWKIQKYCEGRRDQFAMLELHYAKLKAFMEKRADWLILQGLKLQLLKI